MESMQDIAQTLSSFHADLNRIQTLAGTLSQVEKKHFEDLTKYDDERLRNIAIAEQNSARQLGEIKQICLAMAQKIDEIRDSIKNG